MDLAPGDRVDRYVVEARLGEGGMAVVYRVRHAELGTLHALKVLSIRAPGIAERTLQEGRIQATVRHENLVAVTDALRIDGSPALVLEYVDGPSLQQLITHHPPHQGQIDDLARQILRGVAHAHRHGLVHRDLKPSNVLISTAGGRIVPKVADFGMAKVLDDALRRDGHATRSGIGLGTPAWMAPEQFRDAKGVDARADVFALGAILYALIAGTPPFVGTDLVALLDAMRARAWRPVRAWAPSVPARWERAVAAALEPDRDARPPDVDALLALWVGDAGPVPDGLWEPEQVAAIRALAETPAAPADAAGVPPTLDPGALAPSGSVRPTLAPPLPTRRAGLAVAALLGASALFAALGAAGALAVWAALDAPETAPPVEAAPVTTAAPVHPAPAEPEPPAPAAVAPSPRPSPTPTRPATVAPLPEPEPAPPPPAPAPAPAPEPPADTALVTVSGVSRAYLAGPSGERLAPGAVPPGRYTLWVFFDGAAPTAMLDLDLSAGDRRSVTCESTMRICR